VLVEGVGDREPPSGLSSALRERCDPGPESGQEKEGIVSGNQGCKWFTPKSGSGPKSADDGPGAGPHFRDSHHLVRGPNGGRPGHWKIGMSRGGESAGKRRITAQRNDRKAAKTERRQQRRQEENLDPDDQARTMSRFHRLNELREAGTITEVEFEQQRHEIFVSLGLEEP
jgi:hypothetical protein